MFCVISETTQESKRHLETHQGPEHPLKILKDFYNICLELLQGPFDFSLNPLS